MEQRPDLRDDDQPDCNGCGRTTAELPRCFPFVPCGLGWEAGV